MTNKRLDVQNVSKIFRRGSILSRDKIRAVDKVSISIPSDTPTILSIVGESGCGKTTLAKMILGLHTPEEGEIYLDGKPYNELRRKDLRSFRLQVQPIFQNPYESFSSRKKVETYLFNTALNLGISKNRREAEELIDETLKNVGMSYQVVKDKYPTQFSGGELQRVSIARALLTTPKLIVADEPVAAIDASLKMNIVNIFKELKEKYDTSFIYITHDLSTAYYVSDYIATLYAGSLVEYGPAQEIMDKPAHPYTELLMTAIPRVGEKWKDDVEIIDMDEGAINPEACKFAPRCPYATRECRETIPPVVRVQGHDRSTLCYHPRVEPIQEDKHLVT